MPAYLDHAATTALSGRAREAMDVAWQATGNPSSLHSAGRRARAIAEQAREDIARALGAAPGDVVFTSGATEADNLAVIGLFRARKSADPSALRLIVSPTEHHAVLDAVDYLAAHEGAVVRWLRVDHRGVVDLADLRAALAEADDGVTASLVAVMSANNETGTRQPVELIAQVCASAGVPLHCDAVQSAAWERVSFSAAGCSTMAVSAHKVGGPVGIGALLVGRGVRITPTTFGGGQERKLRSGTVNAAAAAGFAAALAERATWVAGAAVADSALQDSSPESVAALRDYLADLIGRCDPSAVINGGEDVLPSILNVTFPGCDADALLMLLDAQGIQCSLGAACTAGVPEPSHVLLAMGMSTQAASSSLRFSLGPDTRRADMDAVAAALPEALTKARAAVMAR